MNIAFYGTLRDRDILTLIAGHDIHDKFYGTAAVKGWASMRIQGASYPLLRSDPHSTTIFHLYHDCSEVSWRRLVEYEGEEYGFATMEIAGHSYRVFMAGPDCAASDEAWTLESFQQNLKRRYLSELGSGFPSEAAPQLS